VCCVEAQSAVSRQPTATGRTAIRITHTAYIWSYKLTGRVARVPLRTVSCAVPRTAQPTRQAICRDPAKRGGIHALE
jgi:hypothetical protein